MDSFTFGKSRAATNLASILDRQPFKIKRKVLSKIHKYQKILFDCFYCNFNATNFFFVFKSVFNQITNNLLDMKIKQGFGEETILIHSHLINILSANYKNYLRRYLVYQKAMEKNYES